MLPVISSCTKILLAFFIASPSSHMCKEFAPRFWDGGSKSKVDTRVDIKPGIGAYAYEITE